MNNPVHPTVYLVFRVNTCIFKYPNQEEGAHWGPDWGLQATVVHWQVREGDHNTLRCCCFVLHLKNPKHSKLGLEEDGHQHSKPSLGLNGRAGMFAHLVVASMLVEQRDDGFNVGSLNDVQSLRTLNQDTVEGLQDP